MSKRRWRGAVLGAVAVEVLASLVAPGCGSSPEKRRVPSLYNPGEAGASGETSSAAGGPTTGGNGGKAGASSAPDAAGAAGAAAEEAGAGGAAGAAGAPNSGGSGGALLTGCALGDPCCANNQCESSLNCLGSVCSCAAALSAGYMLRTDGTAFNTVVNDTAQSVVFNADTALPLHGIVSIMGSGSHGCAALDTGEVRCWPLVSDYTGNNAGQLGNGKVATGTDKFTILSGSLVKVDDNTNLSNVASVGDDDVVSDAPTTTCAVTKDKFLYCWGSGSPQLIDGVTTPTPFAKRIKTAAAGPDLTGVLQVSVGTTNACVLLDTGKVRCWGQSFGAPFYPATDFTVPGTVTKVLTGYSTSCALNTAGAVYCWGQGPALGIGPGASNSASPNRVHTSAADFLDSVTALSIAFGGACVLRSDHTVWCWGGTPSGVGMPYATQMQVGGVMPVAGGVNITDAVAITTPFFASVPRYLTSSGVNYWQGKMFAPNCATVE